MGSKTGYFATKEARDCISSLLNKAKTFHTRMESNDFMYKIRNMWRAYHGFYTNDNHEVNFTGEQGELVDFHVNHFRNLARHMYTMVTSTRPMMEARAINTDYKSLAQTQLANGILDYYMREKDLETVLLRATELAIVTGVGYVKLEWNANSGDAYDVDPDTGELNYEGELEFETRSVFDVIFDGSKETWNNEWILVRSFVNKYNLSATYTDLAEKIEGAETKDSYQIRTLSSFSNDETDDITVWEFFHRRTPSVPEGRYMYFIDGETVMIDTPMPYKELPIYRIVPSEILGTQYGYSPMFDVYPIQECIDSLFSSIMSNQAAFAVQNVFVPRGADLTVNSIEGGLNVIEGNARPEPLQLMQTSPETYQFLQTLIEQAETISGINSVTRGNPEASLRSGNALALVQAMAVQFISQTQQGYVKLVEGVGTGVLTILKDYANTPKLVALVGKHNKPYLREFTGDMISNISRVVVDMGNPLSRTISGRVQMADQMSQMRLLKTPEQYFQVISTGRIDTVYENEISELMLIRDENEMFLEGKKPATTFLDQHRLHIMEHRAVMADPDLRANSPEILQNIAMHIQEHIEHLRNTDPDLLQLINEQPLNPPQASGAPGLPPGPVQAQMSQGGGETAQVMSQQPSPDQVVSEQGAATIPSPPAPMQDLPVMPDQKIN